LNAGQAERERDAGGYSRLPARNPVTARDILTPLFFFKKRVIIAFLAPIILALIAALMAHPVYVAESRLLILLGDDMVMKNPLSAVMPGLSVDRSQIVKAETEILASRELATATVQAVGLERMYPHIRGEMKLQAAAEQLQKDVGIENVPQSNVIRITLRNGDRMIAAEALNKLVSAYQVRRRSIFQQNSQSTVDTEMNALTQQLSQVENQLQQFSLAHGFADFQLEFTGVQNQQIALKNEIHNLDQQLAQRSGRLSQLDKNSQSTPAVTELSTDFVRSQQADALGQSLLSLQNQRRDAAAEYVDGSPIIAELDRRIAKVQSDIAAAPTQQVNAVRRGINPVHQDIDTQLRASQADVAGLSLGKAEAESALRQVTARIDELVRLGPEYRDLMRKRTLMEEAAAQLAKGSQETKLAATVSNSQANVRVLQAATPPLTAHTGRPMMLLSGVVVGLIAATGITVVSAALFQAMLTPNDLEQKLATPVVLAVSSDPDAKPRTSEGGPPGPMFLTPDDGKVLAHLLRSISPGAHCSLQMIGPTDGVGVTALLVDYALLAARERQKVLVLDLEPMRGRSATDALIARGAVLHPVGAEGALARVGQTNLYVTPPAETQELTMGERDWTKLLSQATKEYDLVLIDAPPLSRSWLGLFAAPSVDVTLAVIEAEESRAPVALNMIERIGGVGGVVAAAVLNKRRFYIPKAVYNWI
jgi:succinoglycan biosynthesis transport protein ExoP